MKTKKFLAVLFAAVLLFSCCACSGGEKDDGVLKAEDVIIAPNAENIDTTKYYTGIPDDLSVIYADGSMSVVPQKPFDEGPTPEEVSGGRATHPEKCIFVYYNGVLYNTYTLNMDNAELPGFITGSGGILVLNISGKCAINTYTEGNAFENFDCVVLTGDGELLINGGSGTINSSSKFMDLPALIVNGPKVICQNFTSSSEDSEALLMFDGELNAGIADLDGKASLYGGSFAAGNLYGSEISELYLNDGVWFAGYSEEASVAKITVDGGEVYFMSALPAETEIAVNGGSITAPEISNNNVSKKRGAEVIDPNADKSPVYGYNDITEEQLTLAGGGFDYKTPLLTKAADDVIFTNMLTLNGAEVSVFAPWGGLRVELEGANFINAAGGCGMPSGMFTGSGSIDISGPFNIYSWGSMARPYLEINGASVRIHSGDTKIAEVFSMDGEGDETGSLAVKNGGLLEFDGNAWLRNSVVSVEDGSFVCSREMYMESGALVISGGEVHLKNFAIGEGDIEITGGEVYVEEGLFTEKGNISVSGAKVHIADEGMINSEKGKVNIDDGCLVK